MLLNRQNSYRSRWKQQRFKSSRGNVFREKYCQVPKRHFPTVSAKSKEVWFSDSACVVKSISKDILKDITSTVQLVVNKMGNEKI